MNTPTGTTTAPTGAPDWSLTDLPPAESDACLLAPTLVDAVADAVWRLAGRRVYTWVSDRGSSPQVLIAPTGDDGYAWSRVLPSTWFTLTATEASASTAKRLFFRGDRGQTVEAIANRRHLEAALSGFISMPTPLTASLHDVGQSWQIRAALVGAWWDTRLAEGHTPESARTLLSLLLDTDDLAQCGFLDEPFPPAPAVVRCGRYRLVSIGRSLL